MSKATDPKLVALLICDQVIQDARSGKKSFIGVFDNINAASVPCVRQELAIALVLTGCRGSQNIILEIVFDAPDGERKIIEIDGNLQSNDPLGMVDLIFELKGFALPNFGKYTIRIVLGDSREVIASRPFMVREVNAGGKK